MHYESFFSGVHLKAVGTVYDFYTMKEISAVAHADIFGSNIRIKFLGGKVRTFKPGAPFDVYVKIYFSICHKFLLKILSLTY